MLKNVYKYTLSENVLSYLGALFKGIDLGFNEYSRMANAIQEQSDFYIQNPELETQWNLKSTQVAQVSYYFPLNYLRNLRVMDQFSKLVPEHFLQSFDNYLELGSGLGPSFLSLQDKFETAHFRKILFIESSNWPSQMHQKVFQGSSPKQQVSWSEKQASIENINLKKTIAICSYSLTEFNKIPQWLFECGCVIIIEPSTREDGQRLIKWRSEFLKKNFYVVAPCLHQNMCSLDYEKSKDWCHDRLHIESPDYLKKIEQYLNFKNSTFTLSYVVIVADDLSLNLKNNYTQKARVIGDYLDEKGKSRQLICRSDEREFLTVLKRSNIELEYQRGDIIDIEPHWRKVGSELRVDIKK